MAYEGLLLKYGTDYQQIRHEGVTDERLRAFYGLSGFERTTFDNHQLFDFAGLRGRLLSSSYTPAEGEPGYGEMLDGLRRLFDEFNDHGKIRIDYDTQVYTAAST